MISSERRATLPFTWTLRGHCRIISWPNFNIAVSQGIGRPEERERDGALGGGAGWKMWGAGNGWLVEQSEHIQHLLSSPSYMGMVWASPGGAVVGSLPANAGDAGLSPGLGGSHMPRSGWARGPQLLSLRSATGGAAVVRGPRTVVGSGPRSPQLGRALAQKRRPNTAKKKKKKSNINDHWSQITITNIIIMKKFVILWEWPKCDTETQNERVPLEKWRDRLAPSRDATKLSICRKHSICKVQ